MENNLKQTTEENVSGPNNPKDSSNLIKIVIGDKQFKVAIAQTDEEKEIGLSNTESLSPENGLLFVWDEPDTIGMWMKDTYIPLDIIFIDEDLVVTAVYQGVPNSEEIMEEDNTAFVLEVNQNSGIKVGDELEFSPEKVVKAKMVTTKDSRIESNPDKMSVLNENGKTQMELAGGERIFSRPNTKILIKFAKKANATNKESDFKALGKRVFKFLAEQNKREPEYVD